MVQDDRSGKHVVGHARDLWNADPRGPGSSLVPSVVLLCSHPEGASHCPWDHIPFDGLDYSRSRVSRCRLVCSIPDPCPCLCPCLGHDPSLSCDLLWHHSLGTPSHDRYLVNQQCKYPRNAGEEVTLAHWGRNASGSRIRGRVHLCPCLCHPIDASAGLVMCAGDHLDAARRLARAMRSVSSRTRVW